MTSRDQALEKANLILKYTVISLQHFKRLKWATEIYREAQNLANVLLKRSLTLRPVSLGN